MVGEDPRWPCPEGFPWSFPLNLWRAEGELFWKLPRRRLCIGARPASGVQRKGTMGASEERSRMGLPRHR